MSEAATMDYAGIKAKRKTGTKPTVEDLRLAVETEKANLIRLIVELAEAEAKEYRLMGLMRLGNPDLDAHMRTVVRLGNEARETRRHLAKLINMLHHVENPDEKSELETCQACEKPIQGAITRAGKFSFHSSCVASEGKDDDEDDEDEDYEEEEDLDAAEDEEMLDEEDDDSPFAS